jgi:transcriptional regulator with XRE-family HTH domain
MPELAINWIIMSSSQNLIKQLEQYRLENRLSQEKLAERLSVAFSTVNRWLRGRNMPSKIQQFHIEKLLKTVSKKGKKAK